MILYTLSTHVNAYKSKRQRKVRSRQLSFWNSFTIPSRLLEHYTDLAMFPYACQILRLLDISVFCRAHYLAVPAVGLISHWSSRGESSTGTPSLHVSHSHKPLDPGTHLLMASPEILLCRRNTGKKLSSRMPCLFLGLQINHKQLLCNKRDLAQSVNWIQWTITTKLSTRRS